MKRPTLPLALVMFVGGCWTIGVEYAPRYPLPHPMAEGTWTGVTESATLYDPSGKAHEAVVLRVTSGPPMMAEDGLEYPMPVDPKPVLLDEKGRVMQPQDVSPGQRIEASGLMKPSTPAFLPDVGVLSTKPGHSHVFGIRMNGMPRGIP
jgi:hypothetical protein